MSRVTVIGVGNMGGAILDGLMAKGWATSDLATVDPAVESARSGIRHGTIEEMVPGADAVLVAVKPDAIAGLLGQVADHLDPDTVVISVAAGVSVATLEAALGTANPVARVMPNTPARVGRGVSIVSPGTHTGDDHLALVRSLLEAVGIVEVLPERLQDAATGVSGSGPAYVFAMVDAMIEAGVQQGLPRPVATRLTVQTFLGASTMLDAGTHPVELREQVSSPGGTTVQGLRALDRHGLRPAIADAVEAARQRSEELGRA